MVHELHCDMAKISLKLWPEPPLAAFAPALSWKIGPDAALTQFFKDLGEPCGNYSFLHVFALFILVTYMILLYIAYIAYFGYIGNIA